ncbi:hypothetical protein KBY83_00945 [Cyanobium sp. WKJ7-Wakatipu]|uniref:hypothetical protein n=1 Tax=Cyanobium sp. WKJ7-Wakatipu TaxID=2823726 RepID=UPI0020CF6921|nr:hypothetical protein [Cyanobium sp. WKJ7-Wakatipu]MCP9781883.1 hypothetical protein [Cyanobium sp. WKJ7-Wakatipu]
MTPPTSAPERSGRSEPPAPYPAPYVEPWGRLAGDLRAALASTVLKLRELVRRNREGDLSVPGFWPQALAAFFWPVLLALGLAVVACSLTLLIKTVFFSPTPTTFDIANSSASQPSDEQVAERLAPRSELPLPQALGQPAARSVGSAPSSPEPPELAEPASAVRLELDPLLALLSNDDPDGSISSARPHPEQGLLDLELVSTWAGLPLQRRQQQADLWLQRSRELGYERLRLVAPGGNLLAQAARVGSGMVLLEAETIPQA